MNTNAINLQFPVKRPMKEALILDRYWRKFGGEEWWRHLEHMLVENTGCMVCEVIVARDLNEPGV